MYFAQLSFCIFEWCVSRSIDTIFLVVFEPHRVLECLQGVRFQGKNCFTKTVSNFSEIDFGIPKQKSYQKISKNIIKTFADLISFAANSDADRVINFAFSENRQFCY